MAAPKIAVPQKVRKHNGNVVQIVLYNGKHIGHGKYFAGLINNELVVDENGIPLRYKDIGKLELL